MYHLVSGYLGSQVVGVVSLRGCEVGTEHSFRHVDGDHQALHRLPHGLLGSDRDVQATTRARLKETDVLLHVHRHGHKTKGGNSTVNILKEMKPEFETTPLKQDNDFNVS